MNEVRKDRILSTAIQFVSSESNELHEGLTKATLQAAFLCGHVCDTALPELRRMELFRDNLAVTFASGHALAGEPLPALDQLRDEPVVWLGREVNPTLYDSFLSSCSEQGYRPNIVQEASTFFECLAFVREGLGITYLPQFMKPRGHDETVLFVCLPEGMLHVEYTLVFYANSESHALHRFVKLVQDQTAPRLIGAAASSFKTND